MAAAFTPSRVNAMDSTQSDPRATVTAMWHTRPARRQSDRKLAGVAAALARRYDVDPVLVRIGFVVAALFVIRAITAKKPLPGFEDVA